MSEGWTFQNVSWQIVYRPPLSRWVISTDVHGCLWLTPVKACDAASNPDVLSAPLATPMVLFGLCQLEERFIRVRVFAACLPVHCQWLRGRQENSPLRFFLLPPPLSSLHSPFQRETNLQFQVFPRGAFILDTHTLSHFSSAFSHSLVAIPSSFAPVLGC